MQLHRRRHPEFDETRVYEYPSHLREAIEGMPCAPGVYIFHGAEGDLPLYIGKSVNLRSRLLAHLRNPDEARLLRQTLRISHVRTAALLPITDDGAARVAAAALAETFEREFTAAWRKATGG